MKKVIFYIVYWGLLTSAVSYGQSSSICQRLNHERQCTIDDLASNNIALSLKVQRCLTELMGCHRHRELIDLVLAANSDSMLTIPPIQNYFLGAAYSAIAPQLDQPATHCALAIRARDHFTAFLSEVSDAYWLSGGTGNFNLNHIRHATSASQTLAVDCIESGLSLIQAKNIAADTARTELNDLFMKIRIPDAGDTRPQSDVAKSMNHVFGQLRRFTTKTSELSIGLRMVNTEMEVNRRLIKNILESLNNDLYPDSKQAIAFDKIQMTLDLPSESFRLKEAIAKSKIFRNRSNDLIDARNAIIESLQENYAQKRQLFSQQAYLWASEATFQKNTKTTFMDTPEGQLLRVTAEGQRQVNAPPSVFKETLENFKAVRSSQCDSRRAKNTWYCRSLP